MITLPMPPLLLDLLFSFNISLSMVVLLVAIYSKKPLDFGSFPTVLLLTTILRLSLNAASTRVTLIHGQEGTAAAGHVIESFGQVVMGGSYVVGIIVFSILMIINFIVVTKGAGRISEVTARFTFDAMPGKQMAIDADLNAGLINQEQAKERRQEVTREADFYGSMDGASKSVKGDAVAGLLILIINIVGGIIIGTLQHGLPLSESTRIYTILTIGDGLVAQIPSLLLSVASAIIVTRQSGTEKEMGQQVMGELFSEPKVLFIVAGVLFVMGIVPGMPTVAFLTLSLVAFSLGQFIKRRRAKAAAAAAAKDKNPVEAVPLVDLGGIFEYDKLTTLFGKPQWYLGMTDIRGQKINVADTLKWVSPDAAVREDNYPYIISQGGSTWALGCDVLEGNRTISRDAVKWRQTPGSRPWLAGIVKDERCALLYVKALIALFNKGMGQSEIAQEFGSGA